MGCCEVVEVGLRKSGLSGDLKEGQEKEKREETESSFF